MRQLPSAMQAILNAGPPFTAENRPQTRITVLNVNSSDHSTHTWDVTPSSGPVGNRPANKLPIWWYMDDEFSAFDNALEIPNIKQVVIDRQLLQGAATIQVEIYNTTTPPNGSAGPNPNVFGDPGYFAYARGLYADGNSRWNFTANEWQNQLRENALLYVWQGYGGEDLPLANAIADGYLILDGVFLVDTCAIEAQTGLITLTGRDMGKLLVDQYAWPPVVPQAFYGAGGNNAGITYYITGQGPYDPAVPGYGTGPNQTVWASQRMVAMGADGFTNGCSTPAELVAFANDSEQLAVYQNASSDATNGAINACNGDISTEWVSPTKTAANDFTYIQFACGEEINGVYLDPYLPGVMCYVSIIENGAWVDGSGMVNGGTLVGTIPYVANFGLGTAQTSTNSTDTTQGRWYPLPLTYTASVVQLTFTNLQEPQPGDFAAGLIGDCALGQTQSITGTTKTILDISPTPDGGGYRLFGTDGGVFDYGDSIYFGSLAGQALNGKIIGGDGTADNQGYWMCGADGGVYTFGDAVFYGSLGGETLTAPIVAFRSTPSGNGYYMCGSDGAVYCFGDASYQGRQTGVSNIVDITIHPDNGGYWLLGSDGDVYSFGDVAYHGGLSSLSPNPVTELGTTAVAIDSSGTGGGYRIATALGGVYTFGDAVYYPITGTTDGTIPSPLNSPITGMRRTPDDLGYWLVGGDGGVFTFGDALFIGALPAQFALTGNYGDFATIVEDMLLWAGFWLYPKSTDGVVLSNQAPLVYGNIETTGAYNSIGPIQGTFDKLQLIDVINQLSSIVGYCTDDQTQIFTKRGWLYHHEIVDGDETLAINPETGKSEWSPIEYVYRGHETGIMWQLSTRSHKSLTTANHRWLTYNSSNKKLEWATTDTLSKQSNIPLAAYCDSLPKDKTYSDAFVELVSWWMTEGYDGPTMSGGSSSIAQCLRVNPDKHASIYKALEDEYGLPGKLRQGKATFTMDEMREAQRLYSEGQSAWSLSKKFNISTSTILEWAKNGTSLADWALWRTYSNGFALSRTIRDDLAAVAPRRVPTHEFLLSLTQEQLELYIEKAIDGDGNRHKVKPHYNYSQSFWQKSPERVERFEFACALAGIPTDTFYSAHRDIHRTGLLNKRVVNPVAARKMNNYVNGRRPVPYSGTIWCPTVTKNANWLARRDGTVYYTGNCFRVDEEGSARWSSPNWWSPGNFLDDGTYTTQIPVLDERINLNDYTQTTTDQTTVSQIIVSPVDPYLFGGDPAAVTVTNFIPSGIGNLHGIRKPAMIGTVLNVPITLTDQEVMAELLAIQCYFASRQGQAVAIHNPAICVDDQIQIYERGSAEANTHYVVGVHIEHDLDSGQKLATYSTYWLGSSTTWAINANQNSILAGSQAQNLTYNNEGILVSDQLINFLANTGAKSVQQLVAGATAPTLINPGGPAATSSDIIDPSTIIAEGISP